MKILHLEDQPHFAALVREILDSSFQIRCVDSVCEAHDYLEESRRNGGYDLLLIDLNLTDSTGMETVEELRDYGVPMVVLTCDPTESFVGEAASLGVADYITKDDLMKVNLPLRLKFVQEKERKKGRQKSSLSFDELGPIKQYLSCAVLRNSRVGVGGGRLCAA